MQTHFYISLMLVFITLFSQHHHQTQACFSSSVRRAVTLIARPAITAAAVPGVVVTHATHPLIHAAQQIPKWAYVGAGASAVAVVGGSVIASELSDDDNTTEAPQVSESQSSSTRELIDAAEFFATQMERAVDELKSGAALAVTIINPEGEVLTKVSLSDLGSIMAQIASVRSMQLNMLARLDDTKQKFIDIHRITKIVEENRRGSRSVNMSLVNEEDTSHTFDNGKWTSFISNLSPS